MLSYATYSEAGGIGKTMLAANLGDAHAQNGRDPLLIDLDPQDGDLSKLLGVDEDRADDDVDALTYHLINRPRGDLEDLIRTTDEGVDIIPAHNSLSQLGKWLDLAEETEPGDFDSHRRLLSVLRDAQLHERYDTIIVDPPATEGPHLYNALTATYNVVIPTELSGKGESAIKGLSDLVAGLEDEIGAEIGVLAVVPNRVKHTTDQDHYLEQIESMGYEVPVVIGERASLFEGCWRQQCTAFRYVDEHRSRRRDYEVETLEQIREVAALLEETVADQEVAA